MKLSHLPTIKTINVIIVSNNNVSNIMSFSQSETGKKNAERLFLSLVGNSFAQNGKRLGKKEQNRLVQIGCYNEFDKKGNISHSIQITYSY